MHYGNLHQVDKSCMLSFRTINFSSIELCMFIKKNIERDFQFNSIQCQRKYRQIDGKINILSH